MKRQVYLTATEDETIALGARLAAGWTRPLTVLLIGDLGAGKTTLAKGIVEGFGAARAGDVSSPTFPLIHEYGEPAEVYHIDLYRLDTLAEIESLGIDEILARGAVVLFEWAERFPEILPESRIEIRLAANPGETRTIEVTELP
jgi:tRNA threonylcarbamoyladenosine biosynthesis protein TsaE